MTMLSSSSSNSIIRFRLRYPKQLSCPPIINPSSFSFDSSTCTYSNQYYSTTLTCKRSIRRRRNNNTGTVTSPNKKLTKEEKKRKHIQKSIHFKSKMKKIKHRTNLIQENILSPIQNSKIAIAAKRNIETLDLEKNEFVNQIQMIQTRIRNFILPQSLLLKNRPQLSNKENHLLLRQQELVMDKKWWVYNFAIGCIPPLIVVLVCEYYKSEMEEYFEQMNQNMLEERQQHQQHGVGMSGGRSRRIPSKHHGEESQHLFEIINGNDDFGSRNSNEERGVLDTMKDVLNAIFGKFDSSNDDTTRSNQNMSSNVHDVMNTNSMHVDSNTTSTNTTSTNTTSNVIPSSLSLNLSTDDERHIIVGSKKNNNSSQSQSQPTKDDKNTITIQDLLARIESLEAKLGAVGVIVEKGNACTSTSTSTDTNNTPTNTSSSSSSLPNPKENTQMLASNIQKRIKMRKRQSMMSQEQDRKEEQEKEENDTADNSYIQGWKRIFDNYFLSSSSSMSSLQDDDDNTLGTNNSTDNNKRNKDEKDMNSVSITKSTTIPMPQLQQQQQTATMGEEVTEQNNNEHNSKSTLSVLKWIRNKVFITKEK